MREKLVSCQNECQNELLTCELESAKTSTVKKTNLNRGTLRSSHFFVGEQTWFCTNIINV